jgi:hypothetical protein
MLFGDLIILKALLPHPLAGWQDLSSWGSFHVGLQDKNRGNVRNQKANMPDTTANIPNVMLQAVSMTRLLHCTQLHMESVAAHFRNSL